MKEQNTQEKNIEQLIKEKAVELFSKNGYHGTTIRQIAKEAGCSLPMLYYYYKNKETLFEEIVWNEFNKIIDRMNAAIPQGLSMEEIYYTVIKQRKELNAYEKAVYKLALKVYLGFEGDLKVRGSIVEWEKSRMERNKAILDKICGDKKVLPVFTRVMIRVMENMMEKIIILEEEISDQQIKEEIDFLMDAVRSKA